MPVKKDANKRRQGGLLTLAGNTAQMAQNMVLDETEAKLERELAKEEKRKPRTKLGKARYKGEQLLHSKYVLLVIVILNVVDCLLVLGELMLDIKYVTDLLTQEYDRSAEFIASMKGLYPARLGYLDAEDIQGLEQEVLIGQITWDNTMNGHAAAHRRRRAEDLVPDHVINSNITSNETIHSPAYHGSHHAQSIEEEVAHGLHKASITILGILVVETIFKVFCLGKEMLEHKLECFDGVIVFASFTVDLVFLKGLQQFTVQEFVLILAFMVPWRIIRVVNSLVVAIMDHEHFRLKLLYKQKKKVSNELKDAKDEIKALETCVDALEKMADAAGVPETHVQSKLNFCKSLTSKNSTMGALSSFAVGGQALTKPLPVVRQTDSMFLLTETTDKSDTVRRFEELLKQNPKSTVTELVANIVAERNGSNTASRPRSRSALNPVSHLENLAGNSATFIATMNRDHMINSYREANQLLSVSTKTVGKPANVCQNDHHSSTKYLIDDDDDAKDNNGANLNVSCNETSATLEQGDIEHNSIPRV